MEVVFPDLYPYFRFEVYARTLELPYHQNPFERNLCLIGRRTHFWNPSDTVAGLLRSQLPNVIKTAQATDVNAVADVEQRQAEPFGEYYPYAPAMILIQSDWSIAASIPHGQLIIGCSTPLQLLPDQFVRGAVLEIRTESDEVLWVANESLRRAFSGKTLAARWTRTPQPIKHQDVGLFIEQVLQSYPWLRNARPNHVNDGWLRIWGVLFPEEVGHRTIGEGWVFACAVDKKRPNVGPMPPKYLTAKKNLKKGRGKGRR